MSPWIGLILGLVQGLTEFLPVSPPGHLVITRALLNLAEPPAGFYSCLHLATFLAATLVLRPELERIFAYLLSWIGVRWVSMRSDDMRDGQRLFWALVVGSIPAVVIRLLLEKQTAELFRDPSLVGYALILTGVILLTTRFAPKGKATLQVGSAALIGLSQVAAIIPGVSRSGVAVAGGLWMGIKRVQVVRFSFLLSLPAILGLAITDLGRGVAFTGIPISTLIVAFAAALVSGYLALLVLLRVVVSGRLALFGFYCLAAGIGALLFFSQR